MKSLKELKINESGRIVSVGGKGALRQHFLDMGIIPGVDVKVIRYAPMGDPIEIRIHGYELTLRLADAAKIKVEVLSEQQIEEEKNISSLETAHPGLGEGGRFHDDTNANPLPEDTLLRFALVGNQNSGKTTLFNQLTGSRQHVGNFPGVTVDRKDGAIIGYPDTLITDLPGIYSMSPYSKEELVSRDFVLKEKPHAIINIVDATNIERNMYLTMQLLEMDIPVVVALNMMDEMAGNGGSVDVNRMEKMLGVPVVPISAARNEGVHELVDHAIHIARYQEKPTKQDFCDPDDHGGAVHRCLHSTIHLIEDHARNNDLPVRFAASKAIENDKLIIEQLALDDNELEALEHIFSQMEKERELDRSAAIADMRFSFIMKVCAACVKKPVESKEQRRSQLIDQLLTGKYTAIPIFILVMGTVFYLTFNVIGAFFQDLLASGIEILTVVIDDYLSMLGINEVLHNLVVKGILEGVGSVLSFLPIIITMFFFLSLLEDSGYIARVAFFMDKLLRKLGLSGRSIVPLLIGFGCTVPAVMSSRTLPSERDRKMTILLTPFMSCTAKLPIYAFFIDVFFPRYKALIMVTLYVLGIITGIIVALLYRKILFKGEAVPFVMELPNYRLPSPRNVSMLLWEKSKDFLQRAFSVILIASVVVWFLQSFDFRFNSVSDSSQSILAVISGVIAPLFRPLGLGDWRIVTSLVSGFMAKESVVSVMNVLFTAQGGISKVITPLSAATILAFSLLYTPCVAAIASIKRELGQRWAIYVVIWQCLVAWIVAFLVHLIGLAFIS
ncbi:MAG: ferrous iron transport protein B [Erysipelotrichaceae bacterium]|nr:ferrous iron transport protein B [Erysipelotrichaceae bacterium]